MSGQKKQLVKEVAYNRHGLTAESAEHCWNECLSGFGRMEIIAEAFEDLGLNRHGGNTFEDMDFMPYEEMCRQLHGYGPGLLSEIHRRLAGGERVDGKDSQVYLS